MCDRDRIPIARDSREYRVLSQGILRYMTSDISRTDFLRTVATMLLEFSACDAVELRVERQEQCYRCRAARRSKRPALVEVLRCQRPDIHVLLAGAQDGNPVDELCRLVVAQELPAAAPSETPAGSFWTGSLAQALSALPGTVPKRGAARHAARGARQDGSLAVIPVTAADKMIGLLQLRSRKPDFFQATDIACYEDLAQTIALALVSQRAHASLRERVKELTCLYRLAQLAEAPQVPLGDILQGVVEILPSAWQYPAIAAAHVLFDGHVYATPDPGACVHTQRVDLLVRGLPRGHIEVGYTREKEELDEGPFLKEERSLIDTVARQIALLVERREAAEDQSRLQDQLRHADRLATIGQLSAGVAHELNEPLGNILAFAQLAAKEPAVPPQVARDLDRIVATSLHARDIIRQLMLFARQMPPQKTEVDFNGVIEEGLAFLEARCGNAGVVIERQLAPGLPRMVADPSQLNQVLVNLIVNAVQAMPDGGTLKITTRATGGHIVLTVEDTGAGMVPDVLEEIFTPFFTTKDVNDGTGLGLPVVHGIVTTHGGTISVRSTPGQGSHFEICLPVTGEANDKERVRHATIP